MSSNEDQSAVRDPEEKETEEVEVGGEAVEGGGDEAARRGPVGRSGGWVCVCLCPLPSRSGLEPDIEANSIRSIPVLGCRGYQI